MYANVCTHILSKSSVKDIDSMLVTVNADLSYTAPCLPIAVSTAAPSLRTTAKRGDTPTPS